MSLKPFLPFHNFYIKMHIRATDSHNKTILIKLRFFTIQNLVTPLGYFAVKVSNVFQESGPIPISLLIYFICIKIFFLLECHLHHSLSLIRNGITTPMLLLALPSLSLHFFFFFLDLECHFSFTLVGT